jgi:diacylglycerol O-acyltransferase-2
LDVAVENKFCAARKMSGKVSGITETPPRLFKPYVIFDIKLNAISLALESIKQTLAAMFIVYWLMGPNMILMTVFLIYVLFFSSYKWLGVAYTMWYVYDMGAAERGGRYSTWARQWTVYRHFTNYFPAKLVKTHDLDPNKTYLIGYHPHGIMAYGAFCAFVTDYLGFHELFPGLTPKICTLNCNFYVPLARDFGMATGLCSATKKGVTSLLQRPSGIAAILVPGGADEALHCGDKGKVRLILNKRKGFIKLAIQHGRDLVPSFGFGENTVYEQVPNPEGSRIRHFQDLCKRYLSFTVPKFFGRGLLPYRKPITVVVGSPIDVQKIENPTVEDVMEYHAKYVCAIQNLYDKYNPVYGDPNVQLVVS